MIKRCGKCGSDWDSSLPGGHKNTCPSCRRAYCRRRERELRAKGKMWKQTPRGKEWAKEYHRRARAEKSLPRFTPEGRRRIEEYNRWRLVRLGITGKEHYRARRVKGPGPCEACGADGRHEVHHRDGNPSNNAPENLERLCCVCHKARHRRAA